MDKKKIGKLLIGNIVFVVLFILFFSQGFLGLRLSDANVVKAALALTLGIMMPVFMVLYNYRLLARKAEHKFLDTSSYSVAEIREAMVLYQNSRLFGAVAQSSLEQLGKCEELEGRIEEILLRKFDRGSLTYQKFAGITGAAKEAVLANTAGMLNRMRIIDDREYAKLQNYQNDDIPDEIQIQRLELYNKNIQAVREQRNQNEGILFKLDELMLELASSEVFDASKIQAYQEIDDLIKQIKYYQ